jgi:hypothetical protein
MQFKMKNYLKLIQCLKVAIILRKSDETDTIPELHMLNIQIQSRSKQLEN